MEIESRNKRVVLLDTSSAILLHKAGLLEEFLDIYAAVIAPSVREELTRAGYPGAGEFDRHVRQGLVAVRAPGRAVPETEKPTGLAGLDRGERDLLRLYHEGTGEFIVIDDGRGARYCLELGIPHVNALLFPKILNAASLIGDGDCGRYLDAIIRLGRYSAKVTAFARRSTAADLSFFLP